MSKNNHQILLITSTDLSGNKIISFYVDETGRLQAEIIQDEIKSTALMVKGLPEAWQTELLNTKKQQELRELLERSVFKYNNLDVHVFPDGFGLLGGVG